MDLTRLYELIDARPFRSFDMDLVNGRRVRVEHPDNVHFFPGRQRVKEILIYYPEPDSYSVVFPEGITALHVPPGGNGGSS
jgi:hypothetical protein